MNPAAVSVSAAVSVYAAGGCSESGVVVVAVGDSVQALRASGRARQRVIRCGSMGMISSGVCDSFRRSVSL
jgi:hypothetical protein